MGSSYPVTVVIPAYNAGRSLARAVMSALDTGAAEVVIVNDASTDNTHIIAHEFHQSESRVLSLKNPFRAGVVYSRNRAVDTATYDLIVPLDADDKLLNLGALVEAYEPRRWVYGGWLERQQIPDNKTRDWLMTIEPPPPGMLHRKELGWVTMCFNKDDWRRVGGYDPVFSIGNEIWAFQRALVRKGVLPKRIPDIVFERCTDAPNTERARQWAHLIKPLIDDKYPYPT